MQRYLGHASAEMTRRYQRKRDRFKPTSPRRRGCERQIDAFVAAGGDREIVRSLLGVKTATSRPPSRKRPPITEQFRTTSPKRSASMRRRRSD